MTIMVLLVDNHPAIRTGLRGALEKTGDIRVVGEAVGGEEALQLIEQLRPDVVLLDCHLPGMDGTRVAQAVRARKLPTRLLALSAYDDDQYIRGMMQAGVVGYLLKEESLETVVAAVRAVFSGQEWYSQSVVGKVVSWARAENTVGLDDSELTARELVVLRLMAKGWDNHQIAIDLAISEGTVKNHVTSIYAKLNVRSRAEAVAWAWKEGLVDK